MHPTIYQEFEHIFAERKVSGSVLEIGAVPSNASLLRMNALKGAKEKIGINLDGPYEYEDMKILKGNANCLDCFETGSFDAVISNATLEHDKFFWKTIEEIKRVSKSGAVIAIGVPGYLYLPGEVAYTDKISNIALDKVENATITFRVHDAPGDYYRFSPQTMRDVFFKGMNDVEIKAVMLPPRLIGVAIKP